MLASIYLLAQEPLLQTVHSSITGLRRQTIRLLYSYTAVVNESKSMLLGRIQSMFRRRVAQSCVETENEYVSNRIFFNFI